MMMLVNTNPDCLMFFDGLISTTDYNGFLMLAYNVKNNAHCFKPHLEKKCLSDAEGHGHGHAHGHGLGHAHH